GEKSINKLKQAIEESKKQPLNRLIYALGIRYVGETTAKTLARAVDDLLQLTHFTEDQLKELEDVGIKVAKTVFDFFHSEDNIKLLKQLEDLGLQLKNSTKNLVINGNLNGQTFLFTGTLMQLKRNDAEALVEKNGGKLLSAVSSNLNFLVAGEKAGSKLEKAKKIPSVKIISEEDFLKMIPT
ncbi:MAG TPA: helix-hairpin-helix domain-containing protein, partial [Ferruginibacter sp.]|nr:helix-hairpin-helix domain-containing protein [Ferruginibacter sp.]